MSHYREDNHINNDVLYIVLEHLFLQIILSVPIDEENNEGS